MIHSSITHCLCFQSHLFPSRVLIHHHACCMPHPLHTPWFDCTSIWQELLILKLFTRHCLNLLLHPLSRAQTFSSAPHSQTPSSHVLPLTNCLKFAVPQWSEQWNGWVYHSEFFTSVHNVNRWHCLLCAILHDWPWYSLLLGLVDFVICINCKSLLKTNNSTTEINEQSSGTGLQKQKL